MRKRIERRAFTGVSLAAGTALLLLAPGASIAQQASGLNATPPSQSRSQAPGVPAVAPAAPPGLSAPPTAPAPRQAAVPPPAGAVPAGAPQAAAPGQPGQMPQGANQGGQAPQRVVQTGGAPQALANQIDRSIEAQAMGQFPAMERSIALPQGRIQRSWDRPRAAPGQTAPGTVEFEWQAGLTMGIRTRDNMVTSIVLPEWERAGRPIVGDADGFEAVQMAPNVIGIRHTISGVDTSLHVFGQSGNVYTFYVRGETFNTRDATDLTVYVRARRPRAAVTGRGGPQTSSATGGAFGNAVESSLVAAEDDGINRRVGAGNNPGPFRTLRPPSTDVRHNMRLFAKNPQDAVIAPELVYNDGIHTYLDFGSRADNHERPAVYMVVDGVDTPIASRTIGERGNILMVDAVGDFTLRLGDKTVCVRLDRANPPRLPPVPNFWNRIGNGLSGQSSGGNQ